MLPEGQAEVSSPRSRNARRSSAFPFFPLDLPPIPVTLLPPQGLSLECGPGFPGIVAISSISTVTKQPNGSN